MKRLAIVAVALAGIAAVAIQPELRPALAQGPELAVVRPVTISAQWECQDSRRWYSPTAGGHAALRFPDGADLVGEIAWQTTVKRPGTDALWAIVISPLAGPGRVLFRTLQDDRVGSTRPERLPIPGTLHLAPGTTLWVAVHSDDVPAQPDKPCGAFEAQITAWALGDPPVERYLNVAWSQPARWEPE